MYIYVYTHFLHIYLQYMNIMPDHLTSSVKQRLGVFAGLSSSEKAGAGGGSPYHT